MQTERRIKRVLIASEMILALLTTNKKNVQCIEGLPEGAKAIDAHYEHGAIVLTIEHETFEPVPHGELAPIQKVIYQHYFRNECEKCATINP